MFNRLGIVAVSLFFVLGIAGCDKNHKALNLNLVPAPLKVVENQGFLSVTEGIKLEIEDEELLALQGVFDTELKMIQSSFNGGSDGVKAGLSISPSLSKEEYILEVSEQGIKIQGGSYQAVAMATVTLLQLIDDDQNIRYVFIQDKPANQYRGVMLDLSRAWHSVETIKQVIVLARWYKINYLHLHLTDDALFTFKSNAFPKLASPQHYSPEDLKEINAFARARGVTIIPEVDVPGHSSGFIRAMPELFGIENIRANSYTLNMGKEAVYQALDTLFGEVAQAFPDAPYIHIGGDEVFTGGLGDDPDIIKYMADNRIDGLEELYRHFLVRVGDIVKSKGKKVMLWSGFKPEGKVEIPKDFVVFAWRMSGYPPDKLIEDGYTIINASWQPLYVVNNRKWSPETIYNWSTEIWKGSQDPVDSKGFEVDKTSQIIGGSMSSWEQGQLKIITSLRQRLATMSERVWNQDKTGFDNFKTRMASTDSKLEKLLYAFQLNEDGLTYPEWKDSNFYESMWFDSSLTLSLTPGTKDLVMRYTLDGTDPTIYSPVYTSPIVLDESSSFKAQAYTEGGEKIGYMIQKSYSLNPIQLYAEGLYNNLLPHSWEKHKFVDSMNVSLSSKRGSKIVYTTDGSDPSPSSMAYSMPFTIKESGYVRARLLDENDNTIGRPLREEYVSLQLENSLTTGKPIEGSNEKYAPGNAKYGNNGEIARWDHWGDHVNGNNWVKVDLERIEDISRFKVYTFWDGYRYYEYTIEVSVDGKEWIQVVDESTNRKVSTPEGATHVITPVKARYLKLNLLRNSANPSVHLVEFQAFKE